VPNVLPIYFIFDYMRYFVFYFLFPSLLFSQWTYRTSGNGDMPIAEAKILSEIEYDFEFLLWNNKYLGVNFMINSEFFKEGGQYDLSLFIDESGEIKLKEYKVIDGNIRMNSFINEDGENKDIYYVLNKLKEGVGCVIRIVKDGKKIELFSYTTDSKEAIDFVLN